MKLMPSLQLLVQTCQHLESVNFSHIHCVDIALLNPSVQLIVIVSRIKMSSVVNLSITGLICNSSNQYFPQSQVFPRPKEIKKQPIELENIFKSHI